MIKNFRCQLKKNLAEFFHGVYEQKNKTDATSQAGSFQVTVLVNFLGIFSFPLSLHPVPYLTLPTLLYCLLSHSIWESLVTSVQYPFQPPQIKTHLKKTEKKREKLWEPGIKSPKYFLNNSTILQMRGPGRTDWISQLFHKNIMNSFCSPSPRWTNLIFPSHSKEIDMIFKAKQSSNFSF